MNLDFDLARFRQLLGQSAELTVDLYGSLRGRRVFNSHEQKSVNALFNKPMPLKGMDPEKLLEEEIPKIFHHSTLSISPRFLAYVLGGGTQIGIIADQLSAAINQNLGKWHIAPAATEIERTVIQWIAEFVSYRKDAGGVLLSGGSEANLVCLRVARDHKMPDVKQNGFYGKTPHTICASVETHSCVDKSVEMLGLGKSNFRKIPVTSEFTIQLDALEEQIKKDLADGFTPFCVIGNAGTVNSGAVDPLDGLARIAEKFGLWFHIDGAYGAPAASVPSKKKLFRGLEKADSLALDPHKWLQVPFESGCALIRNWSDLKNSFSNLPSYLKAQSDSDERWDWTQYNFQLTRNFKALKVWMQFQVYGATKLTQVIEDNIALVEHLVRLIQESDDFELMTPSPLSAVCFRYKPNRSATTDSDENFYDDLNNRILLEIERHGEFFVTGTKINGRTALRVCCVNHRTTATDISELIECIRGTGERIYA